MPLPERARHGRIGSCGIVTDKRVRHNAGSMESHSACFLLTLTSHGEHGVLQPVVEYTQSDLARLADSDSDVHHSKTTDVEGYTGRRYGRRLRCET